MKSAVVLYYLQSQEDFGREQPLRLDQELSGCWKKAELVNS
jgi:hypothetical protein